MFECLLVLSLCTRFVGQPLSLPRSTTDRLSTCWFCFRMVPKKPKSVSERHDSVFLDQLPVLPLSNECCFLFSTVNVRMSPRPLPLHSFCRATLSPASLYYGQTKQLLVLF
ncbi:hypothetical protein TNCV_2369521 [Trichonephila clavipes]|nr:hypothetical protein TNCV_2369521 [Trichonephila clavipes]